MVPEGASFNWHTLPLLLEFTPTTPGYAEGGLFVFMATYNVWVGGEHSWNRSYLAEIGYYPLSEEQVTRWITDDLDLETLSERLHRDDEEPDGDDDFPHRYEVENGCLGYGAFTDQTFGVAKEVEGEEDEIIWSGSYEELASLGALENKVPMRSINIDEIGTKEGEKIGVGYCYTFKGGWTIPVELPDDEPFDIRKLVFCVTEADGLGEIVTSIIYNGEDYFEDGSSDGKGCEWYLVQDGDFDMI
jgi:hypothetical protein